MRTNDVFVAIAFAALIQGAPALAIAQASTNTERQKAHVVNRMYQATYGAQERCRPLKDASASLDKAIDQIRRAFPELLSLIENSPYLPQAREHFKTLLNDPTMRSSDEALLQECRGIEYMLRQFVEAPAGQQAANEMIQTLKK